MYRVVYIEVSDAHYTANREMVLWESTDIEECRQYAEEYAADHKGGWYNLYIEKARKVIEWETIEKI